MSRGIYDKVNKVRIPTCGKETFDVDNALSSNSQNAVENRIINAEFNRTYRTTDSAETAIADNDYFPYYDTSASTQKKTLWSTIVAKIKALITPASIGAAEASHTHATSDVTSLSGYSKPSTTAALSTADSLNQALGKMEKLMELIENLIAPIEDGTYYSRSYLMNEYFIRNSLLYRVTQQNCGTSTKITPGTNCELITNGLSYMLYQYMWSDQGEFITTGYCTFTNWAKVYRRGGMGLLTFQGTTSTNVPQWTAVAKVPDDYKPVLSINFMENAWVNYNSNYRNKQQWQLLTNGELRTGTYAIPSGTVIGFTFTYPVVKYNNYN